MQPALQHDSLSSTPAIRLPIDPFQSLDTGGVGQLVSMGVERRYLNSRGHKALAQLDYAEKRKTLTLQYRVPAFAWRDGWYTAGLQFADDDRGAFALAPSRGIELLVAWRELLATMTPAERAHWLAALAAERLEALGQVGFFARLFVILPQRLVQVLAFGEDFFFQFFEFFAALLRSGLAQAPFELFLQFKDAQYFRLCGFFRHGCP